MSRLFSLRIFSLAFAASYSWVVIQNVTPFRYYPLVGRFSMTDLADKTLGPAMSWYGWISAGLVGGVVVSVLVSLLVPRRLIDRIPPVAYCLIPAVMLFAAWMREQDWFLK
jgi:hypothetical protein